MLFSRSLPKKADIFVKSKGALIYKPYYKPLINFKIAGIIMTSIVVLFSTAIFLVPGQQISKTAAMVACPLMPNGDNGNGCNNDWWNNQNANGNDPDNDGDNDTNNSENVTVNPITFTPSNFAVTAPNFTPIETQVPSIPVAVANTNQSNPQNISSISQQLVTIQQQIGGQMQTCVNNANKLAQQIVVLMNQQKQLQSQIDLLNNQANNIDTSTPSGQNKQNAINQRIQQLQQQLDNLGNAISNAQDNMNNANNQCQDKVSNLEQNRGQFESNLDDAFNNAMNIQLPSD